MKVCWKSPSNIAIVKYWGKKGHQLPSNPSVSMTLKHSVTKTTLYVSEPKNNPVITFLFAGQRNELFQVKIQKFFSSVTNYFPKLSKYDLHIESENTFPHSAGIASSASSMSALAIVLLDAENQLNGNYIFDDFFYRQASFLSRLASGSACRSIFPHWVLWGKIDSLIGSDDEYAVPLRNIHPYFRTYHDSVLIVSKRQKNVSSRAGHELMNEHIFADKRFQLAGKNSNDIIRILQKGDAEAFIQIAESEALMLHSLMLTSRPPVLLLQPDSIAVIRKIWQYRQETSVPLGFTIDAGPNIHLLYPESFREKVRDFINDQLVSHCEDGFWIDDCIGDGPVKIES